MLPRFHPTPLSLRGALALAAALCAVPLAPASLAAQPPTRSGAPALYRQADAPIESRLDDLLARMTVAEKVRQLDMYHGAKELMSAQIDESHTPPDAVFSPDKAQALLGSLGIGSIHDLYPTPQQANAIQRWVIAHNRLGIPALFIEEGLLGFNTGTVFPAPLNLAASLHRPPDRCRHRR